MSVDRRIWLLVRPTGVTHHTSHFTLYALGACLLFPLILIGCVRKVDYFEGAPSPPPARLAHLSHPPGQCGPACVKISRAIQLKHPLDRVKRLKEIARNPDLSLHEQLYLIKATLDLEIFGIAEVFKPLATHPYLRYTARKHLLSYTNRLTIQDAESITKLLLQNQGVPDELTEMEKLWSGCFNIDYYALLDLYRQGAHSDEIMTTYYLSRVGAKQPEVIRRWRKRGDSWYVIILKRLRLDPSIIFIPLPPQKDIPEPFYRAYHAYWLGLSEKTPLNDITINRLIQFKVVVTYYDLNPIEVMKEIAGGKTFDEIIREQTKKPRLPEADLSR